MSSLRAVEAAVRLESFTAAARELNLTQSAISQAVRYFEARAGVALFRRTASGLRATDEAKAYAATVAQALANIRDAAEALSPTQRPLVVGVIRSLLHNWLMPHVASFVERHPDISTSLLGLGRDPGEAAQCDVALVIAEDAAPPADGVHFGGEALVAVARPDVARVIGGFLEAQDSARVPLFGTAWPTWWRAATPSWALPQGAVQFRETSAVLNAVEMGQGAGLLPRLVCAHAMARGDLTAVSAIAVGRGRSYWLLTSHHPHAALYAEWMRSLRAD
ncbi:LysR family transcriptional regulator [Sphingopyxis sp.]|jgi:LysR family glycine cleavage system transcriptional activator|uniref:LysR family transcriptional regulator n=1 Tax=Sphingopyxis sp. TaxID=1908224 RepID=UPI003F701F74